MNTHTHPDWNSLVSEFGRSIGLSEMSLGDTGLCRVDLDDCTAIDFETDGVGRLHLYCILPKVSETSRPTLHSAMLEANYSGHREALPVRFAIDPANREELLHFTVPAESAESLETFSTLVSDFSALAHVWCHKSRDLRTATEAPAPIPTPTHSSYA